VTVRFFVVSLSVVLAAAACSEPADPMARGAARFTQCTPCHGDQGWGRQDIEAPPIAGLPAWYVESQLGKFRTGLRGSHFDDAGGLRMRPMALTLPSEGDVKAMSLYVESLPKPANKGDRMLQGTDATKGAQSFAACTACHGMDGSGNQALGAPPIAGHPDWYIASQVKKFKAGVRGTKVGDVHGPTMRAIALGLADDATIHNVAAHVASLPYK
jgi:cytochrome c oxidase subunit II